jgi:hypothetical protein
MKSGAFDSAFSVIDWIPLLLYNKLVNLFFEVLK